MSDALTAAQQSVEAIQTRINNIAQTIKAIELVPGKKSDDVAALDNARARLQILNVRLEDLWHRDVTRPLHAARAEVQAAEQRRQSLSDAARERRAGLQRDLVRHANRHASLESVEEVARQPDGVLDDYRAQIDKQLAEMDRRADEAVAALGQAGEQLRQAEVIAEKLANERYSQLEELRKQADAVVDELAALYETINGKRSLVAVGKTVTLNQAQFLAARDYHRSSAVWALAIVGASVVLFCVAVFLVFINPDERVAKLAMTPQGHANWPIIVELAAGRLSLLVGAAWLIRFTGSLHSRHIQQAVSYQDRTAALDAAKTILEVGNEHERTEALGKMAAYYLAPGDNAFVEKAARDPVPRQVERTIKLLTKPIETLAKATSDAATARK